MTALICEICGGKLVMRPGGLAKCDSCGMEYTKECVQEKIQEIRGAVKIDGPVESVKGVAEKERLLNMANDCLNKGTLDEARRIYTTVAQDFPNDWRGWWGVICATPILQKVYLDAGTAFLDYEFKMALSFAPDNQKEMIEKYRQQRISEYDRIVGNNKRNIEINHLRNSVEELEKEKRELEEELEECECNVKFDKWLKILTSAIYLIVISVIVAVPSWSKWWLLLIIPLGGCFLLGIFARDLGSEIKSKKQRLATINGHITDNKRKIEALLKET